MKHLLNKGLLLISAFVLVYTQNVNINSKLITGLLLSIIAGFICPILIGVEKSPSQEELNHQKLYIYACEVLICIYLITIFTLYPMYIFVSIAAYDIYRYRLKISASLLVLLSVYMCLKCPLIAVLPQICLLAFSLLISAYSVLADSLHARLLSMRDNTAERDILVEQNTRRLLENQDNMILTATLSERNRIAREIHDNVGHMLTRSILQTGAIKVINHDEKLRKPLDQLQSTLDTAMDSMRKSVHDLHDESVDMKAALDNLISGVNDFDIRICYDISGSVPKDVKYSFINIIKESINNAIKHSNGDHMDIKLREHPAFYQLYISDNGTDIQMDSCLSPVASSNGMGLFGMQERVKKLGGTMKINTANGFSILITIMKKEDL